MKKALLAVLLVLGLLAATASAAFASNTWDRHGPKRYTVSLAEKHKPGDPPIRGGG